MFIFYLFLLITVGKVPTCVSNSQSEASSVLYLLLVLPKWRAKVILRLPTYLVFLWGLVNKN